MRTARSVLAAAGSPLTAVVLEAVHGYSRLQGSVGLELPMNPQPTSMAPRWLGHLRSRLVGSALARTPLTFHMRDGSVVRCRLADAGGLLSVHVDGDYMVPGVDWTLAAGILDIGAHVGSFSIWAGRRAPRARIVAVEPNPTTYQMLVENINRNHLEGRVHAIHAALGPERGTATLELLEHSLGTRISRGSEGRVRVRVETLERLAQEGGLETVDIVKMDCEGLEYDVFRTMDFDRLDAVNTIACEYHPEPGHDVRELDAILHAHGFQVTRPAASLGVLWARR